ncbi:MAG TPA: BON domain-containing protein [Sphingomonas sp.]
MSHDSQLQNAVLAELNWDPRVPAGHSGVTASAGIVTLSGHTETYAEKHAAEIAASRVKGVKGVSETIEVRLAHGAKRGDDEIAAAIVNRFSWDVSIPSDAIVPTVENGWVTLTGEVAWHFEKDAAEQDVRRLAGVVGVVNKITVKPRVNVENVSDDITHALHRSWLFDPKLVTVTADGGTIHLTGTVPTYKDRWTAEDTAWASPGAVMVDNRITVG